MITFITGAPGAGKSAALVSMLAELGANRPLYVNGIPELKIDHIPLTDDEAKDWPNTVPDGSVVVVDEVQRLWRPRGPGSKVPTEIQALETHRHRGLDFYVISQKPSLCDKNIRDLTGRHVHLRDIGFLGRWWYEWPEVCDNPGAQWKGAPIKKRYRLPKAIFDKYKSASIHVKPVRSFPMMLLVGILAMVATLALAFYAYKAINARLAPTKLPAAVSAPAGPAPAASVSPAAAAAVRSSNPSYIDNIAAFIPRYSHQPETAPAYDDLRRVRVMPQIVGGFCSTKTGCTCINNQGRDSGLSPEECRTWINNPPFNPYLDEKALADSQNSGHPVPVQGATTTTSGVSSHGAV